MTEPVKIKPAEFWLWVDQVHLTLAPGYVSAVYVYGRYWNAERGVYVARSTVAAQLGITTRQVTRSIAAAVEAKLMVMVKPATRYEPPVYMLSTKAGGVRQIRPLNKSRVDTLGIQGGHARHSGWTAGSTKENHRRELEKRREEKSSIAGHTVSDSASHAAAFQNQSHTEDNMNSDEMRRALNEPLPDYKPQVAEEWRMTIEPNWQRVDEVTIVDHRVAWRPGNGEDRRWPEGWTPWVMQFLPYITRAMHVEWMAEMYKEGNVPRMDWQHKIALRLLRGEERVKRGPAPRFGAADDDDRFGREVFDDRFGGEHV